MAFVAGWYRFWSAQLRARRCLAPAGAPRCMAITLTQHSGPDVKRGGYLRLLGLKSSEQRHSKPGGER